MNAIRGARRLHPFSEELLGAVIMEDQDSDVTDPADWTSAATPGRCLRLGGAETAWMQPGAVVQLRPANVGSVPIRRMGRVQWC